MGLHSFFPLPAVAGTGVSAGERHRAGGGRLCAAVGWGSVREEGRA
ncbi:hypothetical protein ACFQ8C_07450 [Streptomyces sp. NPDC056503]